MSAFEDWGDVPSLLSVHRPRRRETGLPDPCRSAAWCAALPVGAGLLHGAWHSQWVSSHCALGGPRASVVSVSGGVPACLCH